jgi:hypothetical protein
MHEALRHFASRLENERVASGRRRLEHPELAVVDARVLRDLGEIAAHEREVVVLVDLPDCADTLHRRLVTDVAAERVA